MADETETADDTVTTEPTVDNPEQDGGQADAESDRFEDHKWESDEEWQLLLRGLDFGVMAEDRKQKYIEKRKHKYFKEKIDPSHEIPKVETRSRGSRYQAPPSSSTTEEKADTSTNDTSNNNDDDINLDGGNKESSTEQKSESNTKQESKAKPKAKTSSSSSYRSRSRPQLTAFQESLNYFYVLSQWFIFINCVLSPIMSQSHYFALYGVILSHLVALLQNTGRPQFNMYYAQRMFQDENVMIAIYGLIFLMGPPVFVFLTPVAMRSLHMGSYMLSAISEQKMPSIYKQIHPLLKRVTSNYFWFVQNIALAEVAVGIFLIPACFFISRTVILTLFYWQIMHGRYMMSQPIKNAFTLVNQKFESLLTPIPFALKYYKMLANFLYDKVDPVKLQEQMQQQQSGEGGIGSMMKKCNIM